MSSLLTKCCCGKCFFGAKSTDPDATACAHVVTETLEYRCDRPVYNHAYTYYEYSSVSGQTCPCVGTYTTRTSCPASSCIEVDYSHFHCDLAATYTWNYFADAQVLSPPETNNCCGYDNATCDDDQCAGGTASLCSTTHKKITVGTAGSIATGFMTCFQATAISVGTVPKKISDSLVADCVYGDRYFWLQDIADPAALGLEGYRRYAIAVDGTPTLIGLKTLNETVLCVVHKEKWWKRSSNSLTRTDEEGGSASDRSAADCRTPRYWLFACSGVPLFHFEVYDAYHVHGTITEAEMKAIFKAVSLGTELPLVAMNKLEAAGVTEVRDLNRVDGKVIEKSMNYTTGLGNSVTADRYFYARPGGWDYVCHNWASDTSETTMCDASNPLWPHQIPRRYSLPGASQCSFGPSGDQCHTAAPIPTNNCACETVATAAGPGPTTPCVDICSFTPDPAECVIGVTASCATNDGTTCTQDIVVGNCKGVWIQFSQYDLKDLSDASYRCTIVNDGYVCRVPAGGGCSYGDLPDEISHLIPESVSAAERTTPADTSICCGGVGLYNPFGGFNCVSTAPIAPDCPDPDDWGEDLC